MVFMYPSTWFKIAGLELAHFYLLTNLAGCGFAHLEVRDGGTAAEARQATDIYQGENPIYDVAGASLTRAGAEARLLFHDD
jgi:hypothetical protein